MFRKIIAMLLLVVIGISFLPEVSALTGTQGGTITALASGTALSPETATTLIEARLAQYQQLYPVGTSHGNCFTFAQAVQSYLFDQNYAYSYHGNTMYSSNPLRVGRLGTNCTEPTEQKGKDDACIYGDIDGEVNAENVAKLLSQAKPGDVIQGMKYNDRGQHTMVVQSVDSTGVYIYHANWNGARVSIDHFIWSRFAEQWPHVLTLYRAKNYDAINALKDKTFTVSFNANGGAGAGASQTVKWHGKYTNMSTPVRSGYTFAGWFTAKNGGTLVKSGDTVYLGKSATMYAHWQGKPVTISFNANGGSVSQTSKTVTNDAAYGSLPVPTRSGYIFGGWYTSASGGLLITENSAVSLEGNTTLYAHWISGSIKQQTLTVSVSTYLNVRASASSDGEIVGKLINGTQVTYLGEKSGIWYKISNGTLIGWVDSSYLKDDSGSSIVTSEKYTVTTSDLYCRAEPSSSGKILTTLKQGTVVTVTGKSENGFYPVTYGSISGWCSTLYLVKGEVNSLIRRFTVTADKLWCRSGPSTSSATVGYFTEGQILTATGEEENGFIKVSGLGINGWCSMSYLKELSSGINPFTDVKSTHWYYGSVMWAYSAKIVNGMSYNKFDPNGKATRAMFVTILGRYVENMGKTLTYGENTFPDVSQGAYYYDYVRWGVRNGIVMGANGKFLPNNNVTRQEMVVFMYRLAQNLGMDVSVKNASTYNQFPDKGLVASWAQDAMIWAVSCGYIKGSNGYLNPKGNATRAEIVTMLQRFGG